MTEPPRKRPRVSPPPATPAPPPPAPAAAAQGPYAGSQPGAGTQPEAPPHAPFASHAVHPPASYLSSPSVPPTAFQQPSHLASFSYSPARDLLLDDAHRDDALAFYREPRIGSDLNWGFERAVWRDGSVDEGLDALLDSCVVLRRLVSRSCALRTHVESTPPARSLSTWAAKQPQPAADDLLGKIAVMTWRGMLTKLMLAVHEVDNLASGRRGDGWEMNAMVVDVR